MFANGTRVQLGTGRLEAIEKIAVGDEVMAEGTARAGEPRPVVFSNGTGNGTGGRSPVVMVYIDLGGRALIASPDQLFLMPTGKMLRADRLQPGMALTGADGSPVEVTSVRMGQYEGGVHHIAATDIRISPSLDGHLLNVDGVIAGDYVAGLHQPAPPTPVIGTDAYERAYEHVLARVPPHVAERARANPDALRHLHVTCDHPALFAIVIAVIGA